MIRTLHTCRACDVQWLGSEPCWNCGAPGIPSQRDAVLLYDAFTMDYWEPATP